MKDFKIEDIFDEQPGSNSISFVAKFDRSESLVADFKIDTDYKIPILPLRNVMLFPQTMLPINIGRKTSSKLLNDAYKHGTPIAVFSQIDDNVEEPTERDVYRTGVLAKVLRILELPGGMSTAFIQGYDRVRLIEFTNESKKYQMGRIEIYDEIIPSKNDRNFMAVAEACRDIASKYMQTNSGSMNVNGQTFAINNIEDRMMMINFICTSLPIDNKERITNSIAS